LADRTRPQAWLGEADAAFDHAQLDEDAGYQHDSGQHERHVQAAGGLQSVACDDRRDEAHQVGDHGKHRQRPERAAA
jgi:hypothetical protein